MNQIMPQNDGMRANLALELLTTLDESAFFGRISAAVTENFSGLNVQVYQAFEDGHIQLMAENGKTTEIENVSHRAHGLAKHVAKTKRAYYSNSVKRDPLLVNTEYDRNVVAELCVPINSHGTILGTINIRSESEGRLFSEQDIRQVEDILTEIARPLENMRLYLLAKQLNRELTKRIENKEKEVQGPKILSNPELNGAKEEIKIIGHSKAFAQLREMIQKAAPEDFPILIEGESGTGKKLISRYLHNSGARSRSPFIMAHCNTINDSILEVELFGRGEQKGLIELANGGTLVLNDVSEISHNIQSKLLRFLLSGEIYRVGGEDGIKVNVRIISTSRRDLQKMVDEGKIREDLFYRLNTIHLKVPALRERTDDIKVLSEYFLNLNRPKEQFKILTTKALESLGNYNWPGNVQELRNIMERTYVMTSEKFIDVQNLPQLQPVITQIHSRPSQVEEFKEVTIADLERNHILRTLEHLGGNKTRAAKVLGITVKTLYNKLHAYGLAETMLKQ